jgi:hypothetical protein
MSLRVCLVEEKKEREKLKHGNQCIYLDFLFLIYQVKAKSYQTERNPKRDILPRT